MSMMKALFRRVPYVEVLIRNLYWRVGFVHGLAGRLSALRAPKKGAPRPAPERTLDELISALEGLGIRPGQILVVHSSLRALSLDASPAEIIEALLDFLGPEGTLVIPAIPRYPEAPDGIERLTRNLADEVWTYDVQATPPWTGTLARVMMADPRSRRSRMPLNSIVAIGPAVEDMLAHELDTGADGRAPTPNGPGSAWAWMAANGAEIVAIGVDLAHSLTMIHVAEDAYEDDWPVKNWYRPRTFDVVDQGHHSRVHVRERHPKWACFYGEQRLNHDLERAGLVRIVQTGSLTLRGLNAAALLEFLNARKASGYPYFLWRLDR